MRLDSRHLWKRLKQDARRLGEDERGLVSQIDFMTSMVIRLVAFGILLAVATALVHNAVATDYTDKAVAERGASRLADDLLVTTPGDAILNGTCTTAFFEESTGVCGFETTWSDGSSPYLNAALAISDSKHLNVSITDASGSVATLGSTELAIGDPPLDGVGTVQTWHRQVGLDTTGDGDAGWYTLTVSVWK